MVREWNCYSYSSEQLPFSQFNYTELSFLSKSSMVFSSNRRLVEKMAVRFINHTRQTNARRSLEKSGASVTKQAILITSKLSSLGDLAHPRAVIVFGKQVIAIRKVLRLQSHWSKKKKTGKQFFLTIE